MGRICVVTLDHNASTVQGRAMCAAARTEDLQRLRAEGKVEEFLCLATCNRSEVYLVLAEGANTVGVPVSLALPGARVLFDFDAVRHLLRVLLGLESMARGESHIVAQIKQAYAEADACGKVLHRLFQRAIGMAATLRTCYHPGREPSIPFIAADSFAKQIGGREAAGDRAALVVGLGMVGQETAQVLLAMGFRVGITNRSARELDKKLERCAYVEWKTWKAYAANCDAVFLCTGSDRPVLTAADADAMLATRIFDLGSPHQSEPRDGVRITLDEMHGIAANLLEDYDRLLVTLEQEAEKAAGALTSEISMLTDETWKHLAMARAQAVVREKAAAYAEKMKIPEEELALFGASIVKAYLHPLIASPASHSLRTWRILSGEPTGASGE